MQGRGLILPHHTVTQVDGEFTGGEWAKGLIKDERLTVTIRARKAVIVGTGGNNGDPQFRAMFHPGGLEPSLTAKAWAWLGWAGRAAPPTPAASLPG
jgi:hypothetical protein